MRLFKHVVIETNSFCNRKCIFCPKYKDPHNNDKKELPIETIHKVVDELKKLEFNKVGGARIELALYNEPTFDKRLPEIIKYIHDNLPRVHIFFNSNGDFFKTPDQYIELFNSGLRGLELNIYDESRREFLTNIYNEVRRIYGEDKFNKPLSSYGKDNYLITSPSKDRISFLLMDKVNFGGLKTIHKIRNKAGSIDWLPEQVPKIEEPITMVCGFPFRYFVIRANGDVNLCCDDYYNRITYGNLNNNDVSIEGIWSGEENYTEYNINDIRKKLLKKDRDFPPCDVCDNRITYRSHFIYKYWGNLVKPEEIPKTKSKSTKIKKYGEINKIKVVTEINPLTGKYYPPVMYAVYKVLLEAKGRILIEDAATKLLEIQEIRSKDPMKRAKSLFTSTATKLKPDGTFEFGVPVKITKIGNERYIELIKEK